VTRKDPASSRPVALIAFGGNALAPEGGEGTQEEQQAEARALAEVLADLERQYRLLLVHGNGPQVGQVLIQVEAGRRQVPPWSLDACGASSQGIIGYLLEEALRSRAGASGSGCRVATLLTMVEVDADDPAFGKPTKPIGPFYPTFVARDMMSQRGWTMHQQGKQGWRRVVPSPMPIRVHGVDTIRTLLSEGYLVIAGGGGGIPVVTKQDGALHGVEAVIDKDRTAALLAREVRADLFVVLTNVDRVERDHGTDRAAPVDRLTPGEARGMLEEGQFPAGSMGPKIEAALDVVEHTGQSALITSVRCLRKALEEGIGGTRIVA
jgi:carbamate kinase